MPRLASRILIVVAVFVVVIAGILIARTRATRVESMGGNPTNADLSIPNGMLSAVSSSETTARAALGRRGESGGTG